MNTGKRGSIQPTENGGETEPPKLIIVLGMHRSGTSAATRALEALGVSLGSNLMPAVAGDNDRGFFEDLDIQKLNERVLKKLGGGWDSLDEIDPTKLVSPYFTEERREAASILRAKLDAGPFAFKDPRTALLLPLWQCVFEDLELHERYLLVVRNPLEVAASLASRNQMAPTRGMLLWAKYNFSALRFTQDRKPFFLSYERLLNTPRAALQDIARALGVPSPSTENPAIEAYCNEFLALDLRHNNLSRHELTRSGQAPGFVVELYELLLACTNDSGREIDADALTRLARAYAATGPLITYADGLDTTCRRISQDLASATKRLEDLSQTSAARDRDLQHLTNERAQLIEKLEKAQTELQNARNEFDTMRAKFDAEKDLLSQESAARDIEIQRLTAGHIRLSETLAQTQTDPKNARQELETARVSLDAEAPERESTLDAEISALRLDLTHAHALNKTAIARTQDLEKERAELRSDLATVQRDLKDTLNKLNQEKAERERLSLLVASTNSESATARDLVKSLEHQGASLKGDYASKDAVSAGLVEQIEALLAEAERHTGVSDRLEAEVRKLHKTLADLHAQKSDLERRSSERILELERFLDSERVQSNAQLESLRRFADGAKADIVKALREVATLESNLASSNKEASELGFAITENQKTIADLEASLAHTQETANAQKAYISTLEQRVVELHQERALDHVAALDLAKARDDALQDARRYGEIARASRVANGTLRRDLLLARAAVAATHRSLSWRLTAPLRSLMRVSRHPVQSARSITARGARTLWRLVVPARYRTPVRSALFALMPAVFKNTAVYRHWSAASGRAPNRSTDPPVSLGDAVYVPLPATRAPGRLAARAIAFYLPQFHPIPENDLWWGEGFTEWTKVRAATPRFEAHYQPHESDALGYYDLLADRDILQRQSQLASLHGITGFCFYFYWFAGKRLLEGPIQRYLETPEAQTEFCLCWANENWTRRWDGKDNEVLIAQDHSPDDDLAFISHVSAYFRDQRYIRIDGKPLLIVYRPDLLPSAASTAQRWRDWLRKEGFGEVYLAYTQSFENRPPEYYGFDAAIEFPPNNMALEKAAAPPNLADESKALNFYDWTDLCERSHRYSDPGYKLFRGVTPSWDNTARRPHDGAVLLNSSPTRFKEWLSNAVRDTRARFSSPDERLIFINAWNEWAEGAHLEPDRRYGYAWLAAAREALDDTPTTDRRIIVVTHDLHRHGAQYNALAIAKTLRETFRYEVAIIAGGEGDLADDFRAVGELTIVPRFHNRPDTIEAAIANLSGRGFDQAIINSAASAWLAPFLAEQNIKMIGLVHELPSIIAEMGLATDLRTLNELADALVFPTQGALEQDRRTVDLPSWRQACVLPQGLYKGRAMSDLDAKVAAREKLAARLGLPRDSRFALAVGFADQRKGPDIFIEWAQAATARWSDLHFVWVGAVCANMKSALEAKLAGAGDAAKRIHFVGFHENTAEFYSAASLYALTSREDPFPSTALEALAHGTPVITVTGCGGIEELEPYECVSVLADASAARFLQAAARWLDDETARASAARNGRDLVRQRFGFTSYVGSLLSALGADHPGVSVVVPNYNYARYLEQRLESILLQTTPPHEIIVLDDKSTDDSLRVIEKALEGSAINWRIVRNETNSGNVFAQWRKGVECAQSELVWIAEADDWADPRFLEVTTSAFKDDDVVLAYTQSKQLDAAGSVIAPDYLGYVRDISRERWTKNYITSGPREIAEGLSVKNTIPNVSAVLFRRHALMKTLQQHFGEVSSYRVAGDWCVYANALRYGGAAFFADALNYHRRHASSVTISRFGLDELAEIARMQSYISSEFGLDRETRAAAKAYLQKLVDEFGLSHRYAAAELEAVLNRPDNTTPGSSARTAQ
ncbi:MAG: glycoside hydrolase family 99-like domain-containing protein [Hyphomonadaceae bacterium]|nr:glycoside hydrolase family 99-like domain-containing protein [Hyphomonadaceae bacterium]